MLNHYAMQMKGEKLAERIYCKFQIAGLGFFVSALILIASPLSEGLLWSIVLGSSLKFCFSKCLLNRLSIV